MANPKKMKPDRAAIQNRLAEIEALVTRPPEYRVGDVLTHNPALFGEGYNASLEDLGMYPILRVMGTHPSYREMSKFQGSSDDAVKAIPECQALFLAHVDTDGTVTLRWVNSWAYIPAPPEMLRSTHANSLN
jgi:hypothetical protein